MTTRTTRPLALATAFAAALLATAAAAQPPGPPPAAAAGPDGHRFMGPDPAKLAERKAEHLRAALQLRPDQEPALKAFVDATSHDHGSRRDHDRRGPRADRDALTTPQRLDQARARMAERQAAFERRAEATKRFYAQLSPAQQKAFDALRPPGGHGGGPMGGRHGRGPGGHGPWGGGPDRG